MTEAAARVRARCVPRGDCIVWTGATSADGYGVIRLPGSQRLAYVHRVIYEADVGPIPDGLTIDHVAARGCTSKACCNPDHLEAVTRAENVRRGHRILTPEQIDEIRNTDTPANVLAPRFGVQESAISKVRCRRTWKEAA